MIARPFERAAFFICKEMKLNPVLLNPSGIDLQKVRKHLYFHSPTFSKKHNHCGCTFSKRENIKWSIKKVCTVLFCVLCKWGNKKCFYIGDSKFSSEIKPIFQ